MVTFTKSLLAVAVMTTFGVANSATYSTDQELTDKVFTENITAINGATVKVTGEEITAKQFTATNHSDHVSGQGYTYNQSKVMLGNADTKKIMINNSSTGFVSGLAVNGPGNRDFAGSQIHVTTKDLVMDLHSEDNYVYGVYAMNASTDRRDDDSNMNVGAKETAKVVIDAENTIINVSAGTVIDPVYKEHRAIGIVAMSEGEVEINGNLYVNADTAVLARGKAVVNINKDKKADTIVQLNGDINFNYQKETSGTPVRPL